jgi:hypothetical protein
VNIEAPSSVEKTSSPSDCSEEFHGFLGAYSFKPFPKLKLRFNELAPEFTKLLSCLLIEKLRLNRLSCDGDGGFFLSLVPGGFFGLETVSFLVLSFGGGVFLVVEAFCWRLVFFEGFRELHAASN